MIDWESEALTRLAIEALQLSKHRGVLLGGWSGLGAPEFSKTIFKINTVPHEWLFPRMSVVVVHHGGAGTTAASLRAGIPSVTVPFFADQSFWGWQMHKLRVGTKPIPRQRLTAENLAQAIRAASANEMISCAVALGKQICEENGVEKAVRLIERHIQKR
jgi:sterol 3beta-glucosyltransferase